MTIPHGFSAEVRATVQQTGEVRAFGRAYWSAEMPRYAGWDVTLRIPEDEWADVQVWSGCNYLCSAAMVRSLGWVDREAAIETARKIADSRRRRESDEIADALQGCRLKLVDEEAQSDHVPQPEEGAAGQSRIPASPPADGTVEVLQRILASLQAIEARLDAGLRCCGTPASGLSSQPQGSAAEFSCSCVGASTADKRVIRAAAFELPKLRSPYWRDREVRALMVALHRKVTIRDAIAAISAEVGEERAPNRSTLGRIWQPLDKARGAA